MIVVAQDEEGLRMAAAELMEDFFEAPRREENARIAEQSAEPELVLRASAAERQLSPGYYLWLEYIQEGIEQLMDLGIRVDEASLRADEILGLQIVRQARADFHRKHPPCRGHGVTVPGGQLWANCGRPLENAWDEQCADCKAKAS